MNFRKMRQNMQIQETVFEIFRKGKYHVSLPWDLAPNLTSQRRPLLPRGSRVWTGMLRHRQITWHSRNWPIRYCSAKHLVETPHFIIPVGLLCSRPLTVSEAVFVALIAHLSESFTTKKHYKMSSRQHINLPKRMRTMMRCRPTA